MLMRVSTNGVETPILSTDRGTPLEGGGASEHYVVPSEYYFVASGARQASFSLIWSQKDVGNA